MPDSIERVEYYCAVGVPKGWLVDPETGEKGGLFALGGEIVDALSVEEYGLWLAFLQPKTMVDGLRIGAEICGRDVASDVASLVANGYLAAITPSAVFDDATARLRAIPRGMGLGNLDDPLTYEIGLVPGTPLITVGPFGMVVWANLDGTRSLRDAADLAAFQSGQPVSEMQAAATALVVGAMGYGLLFLDRTATLAE
jgi:hypothetical protein